jgi:hypothetical protein
MLQTQQTLVSYDGSLLVSITLARIDGSIRDADLILAPARPTLAGVKRKKTPAKQPTTDTVAGAKYRAQCNQLPDSEREKLSDEFLKLYHASSARESARRR